MSVYALQQPATRKPLSSFFTRPGETIDLEHFRGAAEMLGGERKAFSAIL